MNKLVAVVGMSGAGKSVITEYLESLGFLESSIENGLYRTAPRNYIKRRLLGYAMSRKFNLARNTRFLSRGRF